MGVYYQGSDGHIKSLGDNELQHFKYIKKIGNRYFYTPEELRAYYAESKDKANREATFNRRDAAGDRDFRKNFVKNQTRNRKEDYREHTYIERENGKLTQPTKKEIRENDKRLDKKRKKINKSIDRVYKRENLKISAIKKAKPLIETGKMALRGKEAPKTTKSKYSEEDINRIQRKSWAQNVQRKDALKKKKKREAARKQYSPAARW